MNTQERDAIASICLMAAFADGEKSETERTHIKAILASLGDINSPALYQQVLLKQVSLEQYVQQLSSPESSREQRAATAAIRYDAFVRLFGFW